MPRRRKSLGPDLGPLLKALARRAGLSATRLSLAANVERSHLFKIFKGERIPSFALVESICDACGATVPDLYDPALIPDREDRRPGQPGAKMSAK